MCVQPGNGAGMHVGATYDGNAPDVTGSSAHDTADENLGVLPGITATKLEFLETVLMSSWHNETQSLLASLPVRVTPVCGCQ